MATKGKKVWVRDPALADSDVFAKGTVISDSGGSQVLLQRSPSHNHVAQWSDPHRSLCYSSPWLLLRAQMSGTRRTFLRCCPACWLPLELIIQTEPPFQLTAHLLAHSTAAATAVCGHTDTQAVPSVGAERWGDGGIKYVVR